MRSSSALLEMPSFADASGDWSQRHCHAPDVFTCFEWGVDDSQHVDYCGQLGGTVGAGPCPTDGRVAGCKTTSPFSGKGCAINWAYEPLTEQNVADDCEQRGGQLER